MRKQLLISTAALLAGIGIASAQEMPAGKQSGGAQMEHGAAAQSREQGRGGQAQELSKQGQSQQRQDKRDQTTGQAQRDQSKQGQHDQGMSQGKQSQGMPNEGMPSQQSKGKQSQSKQSQSKQSQTKQSQGKQGQAQQRSQGQRDQTTGQGQGQSSAQDERGQRDRTQGQGQRGQPSSQQIPQQGQAQQGQAQQGTQGAGGSVTLNSQQRTRIQQTVLASRNVPRVNNVNFALSVGTAVPSSVRIVDVPSALIEINPQWRGHQYFVVRDEIIIVDRSRKIVATVPVGSGGAALHSRGGAASVAEVNLTEEQIRRIQIVLNEKGFSIGRPDGRLGPRTIRALTAFQRRQGLEVSGRLDSQTVAALGVSNVSGARGGAQGAGQSSTTGQGGAGSQQAPAQQNQGARNQRPEWGSGWRSPAPGAGAA